jgi:hypothetical protein
MPTRLRLLTKATTEKMGTASRTPNNPTKTGSRITLPPVPVMAATTDETKAAAAIIIQFSLMNLDQGGHLHSMIEHIAPFTKAKRLACKVLRSK